MHIVNGGSKFADGWMWRTMSPVVEQTRSQSPAAIGVEEQRRWPRTECAHELVIHPVRDGIVREAMVAQSKDFSTMGLGLVCQNAFKDGEQFLVPLRTRLGPPLPLLYTVVHCHALEDGRYQIGAELVSVWDLDQVAAGRGRGTVAEIIADGVRGMSEE